MNVDEGVEDKGRYEGSEVDAMVRYCIIRHARSNSGCEAENGRQGGTSRCLD
jgi:hypothetical protein